jgi:pyruvate formate lyase activating enzyme
MEDVKGTVFNIQRYSIHDGPGIRTTVFFKGCPLRCVWCQNPESQAFQQELFYNKERCKGCGRCLTACPEKASEIVEGHSRTDRTLCKACGACAEVCPEEARVLMGKSVSAKEVFAEVKKDAIFYERSGGGVTLSGGEPLAQPEFSIQILSQCKSSGIHAAIDTCGHAPWETVEGVLKVVDLVLYDLKHMDPIEHRKITGVSNALVLENLKRIYHEPHVALAIRIPVIPGFNDTPENMEATASFIVKDLDASVPVHLLPYHRLGDSKREQMESSQPSLGIVSPSDEDMEKLRGYFESRELKAVIGG